MRSFTLATLASLLAISHVDATPAFGTVQGPRTRQIFGFNNGTFIENIAVRPNGHLLLNTFVNGSIFSIDPNAATPKSRYIGSVPGISSVTGITEIARDVYAVSGGIEGADFAFLEGSCRVAVVDLTNRNGVASIRVVAKIDNTTMLNGIASVPGTPRVVISADSVGGRLFRTDTGTGAVDVVLEDERLSAGATPVRVPLGINGLKLFRNYLYMTNSERQWFGRIKVDQRGNICGRLEILYQFPANVENSPDDFSMDRYGNAYITSQRDSFIRVTPRGVATTPIDPNSAITLFLPTSSAQSRDGRTVYVATGSGQVVAVRV